MKRFQLTQHDLSAEAYHSYSNSDWTVFIKNGIYYINDHDSASDAFKIGSLKDVNVFFENEYNESKEA